MRDYESDAWGKEEFELFKQYLIDIWFTAAQDFLERRHDTVTREGNWYHYHSNWGLGNALFNAALMLSLPQENRGAIIGFVQSASVGGQALSSVFYGIVCDIYPIVNVFVISSILMLIPLLMMCLNKNTYEFVLNH